MAKQIGISTNSCPKCDAWTTSLLGHTKDGLEELSCDCGFTFTAEPGPSLAHLRKTEMARYPYHSWSLGQTVTSRDHENHVAKKLDMVPIESRRTFNKGTLPKKLKGKTIAVTKR